MKPSLKKRAVIHQWLRRKFGRAEVCENPVCEGVSANFDWALKTGKNYELIRSNFIQLCRSCHRKYDIASGLHKIQMNIFRLSGVKNGSKNGKVRCKFTATEAHKIREKYKRSSKTQTELAQEYGVDQSTISLLVSYKTYA